MSSFSRLTGHVGMVLVESSGHRRSGKTRWGCFKQWSKCNEEETKFSEMKMDKKVIFFFFFDTQSMAMWKVLCGDVVCVPLTSPDGVALCTTHVTPAKFESTVIFKVGIFIFLLKRNTDGVELYL